MQNAILIIGMMAVVATIIAISHNKKNNNNALQERRVMAIAPKKQERELIILEAYKILEQRSKEREQMRKWNHFAIHSKKFRVRKKYINRIKKYNKLKLQLRKVN